MRLWFLLLVVVVLAAVFACSAFYRQPLISATLSEVSGRLDTSQTATGGSDTRSRANRPSEPQIDSFVPLSRSVVDGVEKLVIFVGYQRSGHSIIGSMMDAHPNMVISHEYFLVPRCVDSARDKFPKNKSAIFNALYDSSYNAATSGWRSEKNTSRGYNLHVPTPWQGAFTHLRVIGDKGGGATSMVFIRNYHSAKKCLQAIMDVVKVPLIFFHVVRNPYDMIATEVLLHMGQFNVRAENLTVAKPDYILVKVIANRLFSFATGVTRVMKLTKVIEIHADEFVADPRKTVRGICSALSLPCPEQYVEACYEKTFRKASKSRYNMKWSPDLLQYIGNKMKDFPFFSRYTFDS